MSFYIAKTMQVPFNTAIEKVIAALKEEGFGILTDIDVSSTLKTKLDGAPIAFSARATPSSRIALFRMKTKLASCSRAMSFCKSSPMAT
jgi:hypothetical protein